MRAICSLYIRVQYSFGLLSGYQNAEEAGNEYTPPLRLRFVRRSCCEEQRVPSNTRGRGDGKGAKLRWTVFEKTSSGTSGDITLPLSAYNWSVLLITDTCFEECDGL